MKKLASILLFAVTAISGALAAAPSAPVSTRVLERGRNHKVVEVTRRATNELGQVIQTTNRITVLGQGMHYRDAAGQWIESRPVIQSFVGGIACTGASYRVILSHNLNQAGSVDLEAGGERVVSHPLSLYFYDPESGRSVLLGRIQDCQAEVVSTNEVIYGDAFAPVNGSGVEAAVTYRYEAGRFSQDVTLTAKPAVTPADLGLGNRTRLEVMSEILSSPAITKETHVWRTETNALVRASMVEPDLVDETLTLGLELTMTLGRAFPATATEGRPSGPGVPVAKRLIESQGRTLLLESVEWNRVKSELEKLPGGSPGASSTNRQARLGRELPEMAMAVDGSRASALQANATFESRLRDVRQSSEVTGTLAEVSDQPGQRSPVGFVVDYQLVPGYAGPYTFEPASVCTYRVQSDSWLQNVTFLPGAAIKYDQGASLYIQNGVSFPSSGAPIVFTAVDDNSIGDALGTGNPQGYYANYALYFYYISPITASHLDIRYAQNGIYCYLVNSTFSSSDFANCEQGAYADGCTITLSDVAMCNVPSWYSYGGSGYVVDSGVFSGCGSDADSDGLPDVWEFAYFGNRSQGPGADPDSDGYTNLQEYQNGTNPTVSDFYVVNVSHMQYQEAEPTIAVNPNLNASGHHDISVFSARPVAYSGFGAEIGLMKGFSTDGGQTWTSEIFATGNNPVPSGASVNPPNLPMCDGFDPCAVYDSHGNLFLCYMTGVFPQYSGETWRVVVAELPAGGTWVELASGHSQPKVVASINRGSQSAPLLPARPVQRPSGFATATKTAVGLTLSKGPEHSSKLTEVSHPLRRPKGSQQPPMAVLLTTRELQLARVARSCAYFRIQGLAESISTTASTIGA